MTRWKYVDSDMGVVIYEPTEISFVIELGVLGYFEIHYANNIFTFRMDLGCGKTSPYHPSKFAKTIEASSLWVESLTDKPYGEMKRIVQLMSDVARAELVGGADDKLAELMEVVWEIIG